VSGRTEDAAMPKQPVTPEPTVQVPPEIIGSANPAQDASPSGPDGASGLSIINSKIEQPKRGAKLLTRSRLVGWLEQRRRARVLLISAEAGYGKSTLLNDYATSTDTTCIWYRLETTDGDWITFLSHLVASVREVSPSFGRPTEALLRHIAAMGPSREVVVATFLADLDGVEIAGLTLILDDYQLVEGSADVRMIMSRLLERAPASMRFVLAGRGRPNLPLARLVAQGLVAELTSSDLRFTRSEIEELFDSKYQQPLAPDTFDIVERRTEGWAASLQLVSASIAASRPGEVGAFMQALSGAQGPIYDFLAEEVLARLPALTGRVLIHASLMDRVTPALVEAAISSTDTPISRTQVESALREAETLGLLGESVKGDTRARFHPLLHQFLEHQLIEANTQDQIKSMHLAVANEAEGTYWLVAAKHYALAEHTDDSMRVLGAAASQALGTGAWGAAAEVVALMPDAKPPPAVEVIKARALIDLGRSAEALRLLGSISSSSLDPTDRALVGLTAAAALHSEGEAGQLAVSVTAVAKDPQTPSPLAEVAVAWTNMLHANAGGSISDVSEALKSLSHDLEGRGLHYFAGVTLHNYANAELARGHYALARQLAFQAISELSKTNDSGGLLASTRLIAATALAETGNLEGGTEAAIEAASGPNATADSIAEAAFLCAVVGRPKTARSLLAKFAKGEARGSRELNSKAQGCYAWIAYETCRGDGVAAKSALLRLLEIEPADIDALARTAVVATELNVLTRDKDLIMTSRTALDTSESQGAWRWMTRARILDAVAHRDKEALELWTEEASSESALALPEMADAVSSVVDLLGPRSRVLEGAIVQSPSRWLPALGRQVRTGTEPVASVAAALVARFGSIDDASLLRDFDLTDGGRTRRRGLATELMRRVSPTVRVHDLGPTTYQIGNRIIPVTETRRKSASLLFCLVARPNFAATRDQVMESLWPEQTPKSALNSLHQTLFFLRRDIEPWFQEGSTASYVRMESDLVYLDSDLFQVDSVAFMRQAADILASNASPERGAELLRLYVGRFAPEFEYEEWADEWRTQLHGTYLHLAHSTGEALMQGRRYREAAEVLSRVATIDPLAFELRAMLVAALAAVGSSDAAMTHYKNLADLHARDLGVPIRPYDDMISGAAP
jgi:ATP/maltotriose-dependent transcriptional regulator MalT/DNA-binding SARP family transcriptional activator